MNTPRVLMDDLYHELQKIPGIKGRISLSDLVNICKALNAKIDERTTDAPKKGQGEEQ